MKKELKFFLLGMASVIVAAGVIIGVIVLFTSGLFGNNEDNDNGEFTSLKKDNQYKIVCEQLNDIKFISNGSFITNDNELYLFNKDQLYSNDSNCKKVESKGILKIIFNHYIDKDNNAYYLNYRDYKLEIIEDTRWLNLKDYILYQESEIYDKDNNKIAYALKNDNKLYKITFKQNDYSGQWEEVKEEELQVFNNEKVIDFRVNYNGSLDFVKTDKAYYTSKEINNCDKYADIKCEYEIIKNDILTKEYNNIAIVNENGSSVIMKNGDYYYSR